MLHILRLIVMAELSATIIKHNSTAVVQLLPLHSTFNSPIDWLWNGKNNWDSCRCHPIRSKKDSHTSSDWLLMYQYKMCPLVYLVNEHMLQIYIRMILIFFIKHLHTFIIIFNSLFIFSCIGSHKYVELWAEKVNHSIL